MPIGENEESFFSPEIFDFKRISKQKRVEYARAARKTLSLAWGVVEMEEMKKKTLKIGRLKISVGDILGCWYKLILQKYIVMSPIPQHVGRYVTVLTDILNHAID